MGENLSENIDKSPKSLLRCDYMANESNLSFKFHQINDHHIRDTISMTETSKGFANDNVSSSISGM